MLEIFHAKISKKRHAAWRRICHIGCLANLFFISLPVEPHGFYRDSSGEQAAVRKG